LLFLLALALAAALKAAGVVAVYLDGTVDGTAASLVSAALAEAEGRGSSSSC